MVHLKITITIIIISCCLSCTHYNDFVPDAAKFQFPRDRYPLKGKVKSVVQTETKVEPDEKNPAVLTSPKETQKNEYYFKENGYLYKWISYYNKGIDLEYESEGVELITINFGSNEWSKKSTNEEKGEWKKKDSYNILETKKYVDGEWRTTITKRYDSLYRLLSVEERTGKDVYFSEYRYENDKLTGIYSKNEQQFFKDGLIDSSQYSIGDGDKNTTKYFHNKEGDFSHYLSYTNGMMKSETVYDYVYDDKKNWTTRISHYGKDGRTTVTTTRKITYY
jgi:hypothetical protein